METEFEMLHLSVAGLSRAGIVQAKFSKWKPFPEFFMEIEAQLDHGGMSIAREDVVRLVEEYKMLRNAYETALAQRLART